MLHTPPLQLLQIGGQMGTVVGGGSGGLQLSAPAVPLVFVLPPVAMLPAAETVPPVAMLPPAIVIPPVADVPPEAMAPPVETVLPACGTSAEPADPPEAWPPVRASMPPLGCDVRPPVAVPPDALSTLPPSWLDDVSPAAPPIDSTLRQTFFTWSQRHPSRQGQARPSMSSRRRSLAQFTATAAASAMSVPEKNCCRSLAIQLSQRLNRQRAIAH